MGPAGAGFFGSALPVRDIAEVGVPARGDLGGADAFCDFQRAEVQARSFFEVAGLFVDVCEVAEVAGEAFEVAEALIDLDGAAHQWQGGLVPSGGEVDEAEVCAGAGDVGGVAVLLGDAKALEREGLGAGVVAGSEEELEAQEEEAEVVAVFEGRRDCLARGGEIAGVRGVDGVRDPCGTRYPIAHRFGELIERPAVEELAGMEGHAVVIVRVYVGG